MVFTADFLLLQFEQPDGTLWPVGVLLFEHEADRLHVRTRADLRAAGPEDERVLSPFLSQLSADASTLSGGSILRELEDSLSNSVRLTERTSIPVGDLDAVLNDLASRHLR